MKMKTGYCGNIHAGTTLDELLANLGRYALPIREAVCGPDACLGIGLWLSRAGVAEALAGGRWPELKRLLEENGLVPRTFNAFPWADFHQPVVKHEVYLPAWNDHRRLDYTRDVARLLDRILPPGMPGSISTVPLGWPASLAREEDLRQATENLRTCARFLADLESARDRLIVLALEPEPGCQLSTSLDLCEYFCHRLGSDDEQAVRRHLGVCHDVCHAAVMFESQKTALDRYRDAGIRIAKVQISSAIQVDLCGGDLQTTARDRLQAFAEPRYLHQTGIRHPRGAFEFVEDLPAVLPRIATLESGTCLRVHFHVPVHLEAIDGIVGTTRDQIRDCLDWFSGQKRGLAETGWPHFEVETYAWSVAPEAVQGGTLTDSVVAELRWLHGEMEAAGL